VNLLINLYDHHLKWNKCVTVPFMTEQAT